MVVDTLFPTCPVRNVLARLCEPDALWVIQLLGERQMMTQDELCQEMKGLNQNQILAAVTLLIEDNIMILNGRNYRLSPLGKSLLPAVKELIDWCIQHETYFQPQ